MPVQTQLQQRRGTAASWTSTNPTLAAGEIGFESDTNKFKIGTGSTAWASLPYAASTSPLTTKGDLATFSTAVTRLPVGANGETIVADSSTSTGLRWQGNYAAGKNAIINGAFNVWQRGTSFAISANAAYGPDRFLCDSGSLNYTFSRQAFTAGTAPAAGYESQYFLRAAATSGSGGFPKIYQKIEDVRTFAGQTVTLSVWAKSSTAGNNGALQMVQYFGTGGSPSSTWFSSSNTLALTTSWQRFSVTFTLPSFSGSTVGTNQDSWLGVYLNLPSSGTVSVDTWGWQLEAGSVATAFQTATGTIQGELAACQRYYYRATGGSAYQPFGIAIGVTSTAANVYFHHKVTMRTTPTSIDFANLEITDNQTFANAVSAVTLNQQNAQTTMFLATTTGLTRSFVFNCSASNNTNAYVAVSAEL